MAAERVELLAFQPVYGGIITNELLHHLAVDVAGNCCGCVKDKFEHICFSGLLSTIELNRLSDIATRLGTVLAQLSAEFGWPFQRLTFSEHILWGTRDYRRQDSEMFDVIASGVRWHWLAGISEMKSRCGVSCGPGGCPDGIILCAYQDALKTHMKEWIDSISFVQDQRVEVRRRDFVISSILPMTAPAIVMSDIWSLEFLAIILKSPKVESLIQSLREALGDWLCGSGQPRWTADLPQNWHERCIYWRGHDHGLISQL